MNLIKDYWTKDDIGVFQNYILSLKNTLEKINWTKNIINTKKEVLAIPSIELKNIAKEISKGNFFSFLDLNLNNYHENIIINAYLINKIKDYSTAEHYLLKYLKDVDNWAGTDALKLKTKNNELEYLALSKKPS